MTDFFLNDKLILKSELLLPRFKWIKVARVCKMQLKNLGAEVYFYGMEDQTQAL
ncbi:U exon, partial [Duck atadenovirus A]|uniref:U exon n=1 Tax=Duck atadenovirus A TaxID=130328 RepID=UPI00001D96A2